MEYVNLGRSGLKVSKVILGAMSYGSSKWQGWCLDEAESLPILKHAYDHGITTWDTADVYSYGKSEEIIAKAIEKYNIPRRKLVILSKCYFGIPDDRSSTFNRDLAGNNDGEMVNQVGLSRKHIIDAVDHSIERLGTYIDVLQIHRLDRSVPKEEIMRALNDVVESGKVRYIGASSMAAWEFQQLQNIAERNGWHKFISMQNYYNLLYREEEREMIPYCNDVGIGLIPWSPVARGALTRPWNDQSTHREKTDWAIKYLVRDGNRDVEEVIVGRVEEVAKKMGVSMAGVATAWVLAKGAMPIIGLGSKERIEETVKNIKIKLSEEDMKYLEEPYRPQAIKGH